MRNGWWGGLLQQDGQRQLLLGGETEVKTQRIRKGKSWEKQEINFPGPVGTGNMKTLKWEKSWKIKEVGGQCDQNTNSRENSTGWDRILETFTSTNYLEGM